MIRADPRAIQGAGNGDTAEFAGRLAGERPEQAADRCPRAAGDDRLTCFAHVCNDTQ
jgi:hypothetical protein